MKRSLIAVLLAAASTAPAYAVIPHVGDETDLSWQYIPPTAKHFADAPAAATKAPVRIGDETDTSWIYAPTAKPLFEQAGANASAQPYVEFADENVLAWLYQAPTAGRFADPRRQEPYVAFGSSQNPIARLRERMSGSPSAD
jgi:hypothetical protein